MNTVRPNGKVYRPRRGLRSVPFSDEEAGGGRHGVIVLGTLDTEMARPVAEQTGCECGEPDLSAGSPSWLRDGFANGNRWWLPDEVRGAPAVTFECAT